MRGFGRAPSGWSRELAPLARRVGAVVGRAWLRLAKESTLMRTLQLDFGNAEIRGGLEHFEPYGFTSSPQAGAEAVALFPGGSRDHGLVVVVADRRYRLQGLEAGEVALHDDRGNRLVFRRDGTLEITTSAAVAIASPSVTITGDLEVDGDVSDGVSSMQDMRDTFNLHTHPEHDGGSTGPPATTMQ